MTEKSLKGEERTGHRGQKKVRSKTSKCPRPSSPDMKMVLVVVFLFLIVSQVMIFHVSREMWFDVAFSLETVHLMDEQKMNWKEYDVHPPQYYMLLWGWQQIRPEAISEHIWSQELSVLFGVLFLIFASFALKPWFKYTEDALLLLALGTAFLHYGTEPRAYMLLLLLSAIVLDSVLNRRNRFLGLIALFAIPLTHYIASVFIPIVIFISWVLWKDVKETISYAIIGCTGIVTTLAFALPQRFRTEGTWFLDPQILDWPDTLFGSLFYLDGVQSGLFSAVVYGIVCIGALFLMYRVFSSVKGKMSQRQKVSLMLAALLYVPLVYLIGIQFVSGGFSQLYHPRFFYIVTWIGMFVLLHELFVVLDKKRYEDIILFGIVVVYVIMFLQYDATAHHELENLVANTPCDEITIVHESPFSALPYIVAARERGCEWRNVVSTKISERMANGGGYDALPEEDIYWDLRLPDDETFYYVSAVNIVPTDGAYEEVYAEQGVRLLKVTNSKYVLSDEEWIERVWYDYEGLYSGASPRTCCQLCANINISACSCIYTMVCNGERVYQLERDIQ